MKKISILLFFAICAVVVMAQSALSPMTRNYLHLRKQQSLENVQSPYSRSISKVNDVDMVSVFVHFNSAIDVALLEEYEAIVGNIFEKVLVVSAYIPADNLEALAENPEIRYVEISQTIYQKMDQARAMSFVDDVHNGTAPLTKGYKGKGVVVGIVDNGFQYNHPAFYDDNRQKLRLKYVWEQNRTNVRPDGYNYGNEHSTEDMIISAIYDNRLYDDMGHGTHVAGIAAGARGYDGNPYYGVASESDLIFVSLDASRISTHSATDAVEYIFNKAAAEGKPAVVNLSLGTHIGPHDGTSTTDRIFDSLMGEGKIIVGAAGNEGADKFHISKTFTANDTILKSMFKYKYSTEEMNPYYYVPMVEFWGDSVADFEVQLVVYSRLKKAILAESNFISARELVRDTNIRFQLETKEEGVVDVDFKIRVSSEINPFNKKPHISMQPTCYKELYAHYLGVVIKAKEGTVHSWTDDYFIFYNNNKIAGWTDGNAETSVGEIGGTSKRMISVGSYNTRSRTDDNEIGQISSFSSMGPTADGRMKPEIVAPGSSIVSSLPNTSAVLQKMDKAEEFEIDGVKYYYGYMQGTSMACPHVAGVIATWLQADPTLTPEDIKEVFTHTAIRDSYSGWEQPNNTYGYGKINAYAGLLYVLGLSTDVQDPELPASMILYPNPTSGAFNIGFIRDDENVSVSVYGVNGQLVMSESLGKVSQGQDTMYDLSGVANGAYIVKVTGDNYTETFRLLVNK